MALVTSFGGMEQYHKDNNLGWCRYVVFKAQVNINDPVPSDFVKK